MEMSEITFDIAVEHILLKEGGYVDDPADRGGETKYGISKRSYPSLDIKALSKDKAKEIYKIDFWNSVKAEHLPEQLRLTVFDMAVNAGVKRAILLLQECAKVEMDGVIGPKTLKAAQFVGLFHYESARIAYYNRLRQPRFLVGWTNRAAYMTNTTIALLT